ncbi:MAG TPA: CBS domain-containing protein [Clostridiales bacterium]|mgnify:CR=1 FL=1|nr:CBS domain-containing protein [Clostridiales bacterium]
MKVSDLMTKNVVSISPDESTSLAARLLYRHNIGSLPVCSSDGKLRGILTDRDIVLRCVAAENDPEHTPVREIMSRAPISTSPDDDVRQAAEMMAAHQIRRLPVTKEGKLVGMLSLGDISRTHSYNMEASRALSEISMNIKKR